MFGDKKHIDYQHVSLTFAYNGIVVGDDEEHNIPFTEYLATAVGKGERYMISDNGESLIDFIRTIDRELEDEDYLWPGMAVTELLNVHVKFDFINRRYIAVNQMNDIVIIMKNGHRVIKEISSIMEMLSHYIVVPSCI